MTGPTAQPPSAAPSPHHAKHQHNNDHDDQHPQPCLHGGLLGRRRAVRGDATAAHPSKQLGHGQTTSQARIDGRATRRLAGPLHPATCPPIWAGRAGCQTGRRPRVSPGGPEPFGPRPASPAPTVSTSTREEDRKASTDATTASPTGAIWRGREEFALLRGEQSKHGDAETQWQTPRRRRRTDGARLRRNPNVRRGRLHRPALPVHPARHCAIHQGWDRQKVTQPRRRRP